MATLAITTQSEKLFARANAVTPGGVNSPVRAFRSVGGTPRFIARGRGARIWDEDGNRFIDFVMSWGPLILGHAAPEVVDAIMGALSSGTTFGAPTVREVELAEAITRAMPSVEMVRFVNSGTEASMSALRLARAFTGRNRVVKFAGCYHGHVDALLVQAGSGVATLALPDSPGVPPHWAADTLVAPYNDLAAVDAIFAEHASTIAAIIVEPIAGNMGVVLPAEGFLAGLRSICDRHGALLIFDEVITGFRVGRGGAQALYDIRPDLTLLGKIVGGGLPVGAYGGRRDIMALIAPSGSVYQAGTLSGNPLAMAAGLATLSALNESLYIELERRMERLTDSLAATARANGRSVQINRVGSMATMFFTDEPVVDYASALRADRATYAGYFQRMLSAGSYLAPAAFEAFFVSRAHDDAIIDEAIEHSRKALVR